MRIKERMNLYMCQYGCHNVTVDVDEGVTPFMIDCEFRGRPDRPLNPNYAKDGRCVGVAKSTFYPQQLPPGAPYPKPTHEWYRPSKEELSMLSLAEIEHVNNGGLLLRKRTNAEMLLHKVEA